jgi:hypothetical protein
MPADAVGSIVCMRLLHHISDPAHRLSMPREFHRVSRDSLIVSLWVDSDYKAWKRKLVGWVERSDTHAALRSTPWLAWKRDGYRSTPPILRIHKKSRHCVDDEGGY